MRKADAIGTIFILCLIILLSQGGNGEKYTNTKGEGPGTRLVHALEKPEGLVDNGMARASVKNIDESHFAHEAVVYFNNQITGIAWIEEKPLNMPITRGEFIALFASTILNLPANEGIAPPFADWHTIEAAYQPAMAYFYHIGVLQGSLVQEELQSRGNENITREDMLVFLGRYDNLSLEELETMVFDSSYTDDENMANYARAYIYYYSDLNMVTGYPSGEFKPTDALLMGEAMKLLFSHSQLYREEEQLEPLIIYEKTETSIYAGNRQIGFMDDRLLQGSFAQPMGIAVYGNSLLVADNGSHLIRELSPIRVKTILGQKTHINTSGMPVGAYVDGRGKEAYLEAPAYIKADDNGDFIFTETGNHLVRKYIKAYDIVVTVAGNSFKGNREGVGKNALFDSPSGLAMDKEKNIYVADTLNHQIKKIDSHGKVTVFAGTGEKGYEDGSVWAATFREPTDIFYFEDALYVLDGGNCLLRKIEEGKVTTIAGKITPIDEATGNLVGGFRDGSSDEAAFRNPQGLFVVSADEIYIADTYNHAIRKVSAGAVSTMAGGSSFNQVGKADEAGFHEPRGIVYVKGKIWVSDTNNHVIKVIEINQ